MNGAMCFIYSLKSCYFRQRDTRRRVQTPAGPQRPCSLWLRAHVQLTSCWRAPTCQLPNCVHAPGLGRLWGSQTFPLAMVPMPQAPENRLQPLHKDALDTLVGVDKRIKTWPLSTVVLHASPGQDGCSHVPPKTLQGIHVQLKPSLHLDPAGPLTGSGQQQWSWDRGGGRVLEEPQGDKVREMGAENTSRRQAGGRR